MNKPKNLTQLIDYLEKNPRTTFTYKDGGIENQKRIYRGTGLAGINWNIVDNENNHCGIGITPIYCDIANIRISYHNNGFDVYAFNTSMQFTYLD